MKFDLPSFLMGYGAGAGTVLVTRHLRPLLLEVATSAYHFVDMVMARAAMKHEDLEDLLAEAKARARGGDRKRPADEARA
ncbi:MULTISPECIES: hypothetical protein [unclassified Corallococcus]|uniref:hypothetical protein n=1 Tax=unclassified Corallococcus TaxID=2685029 RepID=UPI001A8CC7D4|nr:MULTISPECIES: hypothetical protein [unclassified Corallococcus]MBN9686162.1 hypothetical protein [Corallococcus sp. NCSPR001]WAS82406.1 hypothetical protein O0N60_24110 [Corallococcus sp. NCRR]